MAHFFERLSGAKLDGIFENSKVFEVQLLSLKNSSIESHVFTDFLSIKLLIFFLTRGACPPCLSSLSSLSLIPLFPYSQCFNKGIRERWLLNFRLLMTEEPLNPLPPTS
jgi:hypothetical protein